MAKNMCFKPILDMDIIVTLIVLRKSTDIGTHKDYKLVPFLMNQCFDKHKIFGDFFTESFP